MKYQISSNSSNPQWVDNYILHHFVTPIHNQLKATDQLDRFHNEVAVERKKILAQAAETLGIRDISLEDDQIWVDIPDNGDTLMWMLKA
jgi:hypothetical protein